MANETSSGGIGFAGVLTIVFITLKLTNTIDWSWWWVLSPIWLPFAALIAFVILVYGIDFIFNTYQAFAERIGRLDD